jgi:hypothetical protein
MAKAHDELTVITKRYDLILWSCHHTARFPRNLARDSHPPPRPIDAVRDRTLRHRGKVKRRDAPLDGALNLALVNIASLVRSAQRNYVAPATRISYRRRGRMTRWPGRSGRPRGSRALPGRLQAFISCSFGVFAEAPPQLRRRQFNGALIGCKLEADASAIDGDAQPGRTRGQPEPAAQLRLAQLINPALEAQQNALPVVGNS